MIRGNVYDPANPTHPYLKFVGAVGGDDCGMVCCSCVLISPTRALAAAHCLDLCSSLDAKFIDGTKSPVVDAQRIDGADLAILTLQNAIAEIQPITLLEEEPRINDYLIVAGWGLESHPSMGAPISRLKWDFTSVLSGTGKSIRWPFDPLSPATFWGDSGGAVILAKNGQLRLAGVICATHNHAAAVWTEVPNISSEYSNHILLSQIQLESMIIANENRAEVTDMMGGGNSIGIENSIEFWIRKIDSQEN